MSLKISPTNRIVMKRYFIIYLIFITLLSVCYASNNCTNLPGNTLCHKGKIKNLYRNGLVSIDGTSITHSTLINGLLTANNAHFFSLEANGSAQLNHCTIRDYALINGALITSFSIFYKSLTVFSHTTHLIHTTIKKNIIISSNNTLPPVLYLNDYSSIVGNVIFKNAQGKVILDNHSVIKGKIINGILQRTLG